MVQLSDFEKIESDPSEITRLDMYMCKQLDFVEHLDLPVDQLFDEISGFWHLFDREEKIEILTELLKLYQAE